MQETRTFSSHIPAIDSEIFKAIGSGAGGTLVVHLTNQDSDNVIVYKFQSSADGGSTWTDIALPVTDGTSVQFALIAGQTQTVRLAPLTQQTRLMAYGDALALISVATVKPSQLDTSKVFVL